MGDGNYKNSKGTTNYCETSKCYYGMTTTQATAASILASTDTTGDFTVEFADKPGQTGVQYLLEVDIDAAGAGSYPVSAGGAQRDRRRDQLQRQPRQPLR